MNAPLRAQVVAVMALALAVTSHGAWATAGEPQPSDPAGQDPALVVTDDGMVFARDLWPEVEEADTTGGATDGTELAAAESLPSYSLAETFSLHSRPGAQRTIYLDFNGGSLLESNAWLSQGLTLLSYPGWSTDGDAAFSSAERSTIQEVWARVAEDFAPFDVDVTTEPPPSGALWRSSSSDQTYGSRVAFTSSSTVQSQLCGVACGGLAWVSTFPAVTSLGEVYSPAWVFPSSLGNNPKALAEAASHEVGHNLGLSHDGTLTSSYYSGTSLWGPIMGSPYSSGITHWSRGDYASADNYEDDLAIMTARGLPVRLDEAGATPATAAALTTLSNGSGIVSGPGDADWFAVTDCTGTLAASASPSPIGPNLDVRLDVMDASGALRGTDAPATSRTSSGVTGVSASVSVPATGGPFYVAVSGVGSGEGGTSGWSSGGYDDYGSLGQYRLTVSGCGGTTVSDDPSADEPKASRPGAPARPTVKRGPRGGRTTVTVRWTAPTSTGGAPITGYRVRALRLDDAGAVVAKRTTAVLPASTRETRLRLPRARWVMRVKASNRVGWGRWSPRSERVVPR